MISALFGYIILFMAVNYGRKEDSVIPPFSWKGLLIILMVILGAHLVGESHKEPKQRIHMEQSYETKNIQKT
jgi:hypothetical protein